MSTRALLSAVAALVVSMAAHAHDCHISKNSIGDWSIVAVGGFTFAKPISIDLAPTNAPMAGARYSIRCQVLYKDGKIERPDTYEDLQIARRTGALLNEWLEEFVAERYVGAEFKELVKFYYQKRLGRELKFEFPKYVLEKIKNMDSDERIDVDMVAVGLEAEGALREALLQLYELDGAE